MAILRRKLYLWLSAVCEILRISVLSDFPHSIWAGCSTVAWLSKPNVQLKVGLITTNITARSYCGQGNPDKVFNITMWTEQLPQFIYETQLPSTSAGRTPLAFCWSNHTICSQLTSPRRSRNENVQFYQKTRSPSFPKHKKMPSVGKQCSVLFQYYYTWYINTPRIPWKNYSCIMVFFGHNNKLSIIYIHKHIHIYLSKKK